MDDPHLANPLPPEIENSHRLLHGSRYMMWSLQFLLSLSLLSLFITYLTGISLSYSYTYYLSTFFLPLATRALERKYMFLISNGLILVFLATSRGLLDHDHHLGFNGEVMVNKHPDDYVIDVVTTQLETDVVGLKDDRKQSEMEAFSEGEKEEEIVEADDPEEYEEGEEQGGEDDKDEGAEMEAIGSSNCNEDDEELNRKFDEFIRKMKEKLRLEAKQYHIIAA